VLYGSQRETTVSVEIKEVQISLVLRQFDTETIKPNQLSRVARARFLEPIRGDDTGGGPPVWMLPADSGNGHIIVAPDGITLLLRFLSPATGTAENAVKRILDRVPFIFDIHNSIPEDSRPAAIYAGAIVRAVIQKPDLTDHELADSLASEFGLKLPDESEDVSIGYTETLGDRVNCVVQIQSYKRFNSGPVSPNQVRLPAESATERGIDIVVDYNTRRGYNLENDEPVTEELTSKLLNAAISKVESLALPFAVSEASHNG
jgi:hypothetical protein